MEHYFEKINSKEIEGEFVRCLNCNEVMQDSEKEKHNCPLTLQQESFVDLTALLESNQDIKAKIGGLEMYMAEEKKKEELEIKKIEKCVPERTLQKLVYHQILEDIKRVRQYRDQEYIKNDQRRVQGMSFSERMALIDKKKIDWCDAKEKRLIHDSKHFKIKPIREWLSMVDIEMARRRGEGIKFIIKYNLDQVYSVL